MTPMNIATDVSRHRKQNPPVVGRVFNIQRYSLNDGPGIRTTVFLKGCPLRCAWCHNPEGLSAQTSVSFSPEKCICCGNCVTACLNDCHRIEGSGEGLPLSHLYDRTNCKLSGRCATLCPSSALEVVGRSYSVKEVLAEVLEDRAFYARSGGGVTLSGGEPLAQIDFSVAFLKAARKERLHCCIETSGYARWDALARLLPLVDLFLYDFKETDRERHRRYTGQTNDVILKNLRSLHEAGAAIELECPIVAGYNDREDHFEGIVDLAKSLSHLHGVRLLPYHPLGKDKSGRLGLPAPTPPPGGCGAEKIASWIGRMRERGVQVLN